MRTVLALSLLVTLALCGCESSVQTAYGSLQSKAQYPTIVKVGRASRSVRTGPTATTPEHEESSCEGGVCVMPTEGTPPK